MAIDETTASVVRLGLARAHNGRALMVGSWRLRLAAVALPLLILSVFCASARASAFGITYDSLRNDSAGKPGLWMMNANGTGQRGFIPGGSEASWSADGTHLIYETGTTHCTTQSSGGGLTLVNADGTNPVSLGGVCGDARLSPDGAHVAYESAPDSLSVLSVANPNSPTLLVPVPAGQKAIACETPLPNNRVTACSFATEPSWLGTSKVVYSDDTASGGGLWSYPAEGAPSPTQVADTSTTDGINYGISGESVNPAGSQIAISTNLETKNPESIMVIPVGGSTGPFIATAPAGHNYVFPQWSPDGSTIVFEDDGPNNASTIDSVSAGGGAVTVLTPNDQTARNPTYGPGPNAGGISGTVTDDVGDIPLPEGGVTLAATGSNGQVTTATTGANGQYKLSLSPGAYTVAPEGRTFMPASRRVTLAGFTSDVDFDDQPVGIVTLGLEELSFGVASYTIGIPAGLHGPRPGPPEPGFIVTKPLDNTSPQIQRDHVDGEFFPVAFLDGYQPGTTNVAFTYQLKHARIEQAVDFFGGQPVSEQVTVSATSATTIMVPTCSPIPASADLAQAAHALVCLLTEAQKDAALAAYEKYSEDAANYQNSQSALGCFPHADREVLLACAAIGLLRAGAISEATDAKQILDDPPDRHFKQVAKPRPVHPKQIKGRRFKAFDSLISDLARIGSLESALVTSANRESGAYRAKSKSGMKRQRAAIARYAKQIIALEGRIARLKRAADKPLSGLRTKVHPKHLVVVDFSDLIAGDSDLVTAMRPSAR